MNNEKEDKAMKRTIALGSILCLVAPVVLAVDGYPTTTIVELYTATT